MSDWRRWIGVGELAPGELTRFLSDKYCGERRYPDTWMDLKCSTVRHDTAQHTRSGGCGRGRGRNATQSHAGDIGRRIPKSTNPQVPHPLSASLIILPHAT